MSNLANCNGTLFRMSTILYGLATFIGCSESARLIETDPPASEIEYFQSELKFHFDKPVSTVKVNNVEAQPICSPPTRDWQISLRQFDTIWLHPGTHPPAEVCFTVSYTDDTGSHEQDLCNWLPGAVVEFPITEMIESSVENGDIGVDPDLLNTNGITFRFSDDVAGSFEIRKEGGTSLDWIAKWNKGNKGDSLTIIPSTGNKLVNGTTYVIEIYFSDAAGNKLYETITFTTKP